MSSLGHNELKRKEKRAKRDPIIYTDGAPLKAEISTMLQIYMLLLDEVWIALVEI